VRHAVQPVTVTCPRARLQARW